MNINDYDPIMKAIDERRTYEGFQEILRLDRMLTEAEIPHELFKFYEGWSIHLNEGKKVIGEAMEHCASYGYHKDLVEVRGFGLKEPRGWLTAEEAMAYFREAVKNFE